MNSTQYKVVDSDVAVLRELAKRYRDAVESKRNQECRRLWYKHDQCKGERPLLLTENDGGIQMVIGEIQYRCQEPWAREQELWLLEELAHFEVIGDDFPLEPYANVRWKISIGDYGIKTHESKPQTDGTLGAVHIDAVITDLDRDFEKLRPRQYIFDRDGSYQRKAACEHVYEGILGVRFRRNPWWTLGLTQIAIALIGLENLMLYMYDQPENLHRLMAFLRDDHIRMLDWLGREGLLSLNNENDYCGSGSRGYTKDLPAPDFNGTVRTKDMWALLESQETVGVGPDLYGEFVFPYEDSIAKLFGKVYYGCCEPLHTRWNVVKNMANLKRVSISPWCDEEIMAQTLGGQYVYSRKPKPTMVSTERFDEEAILADLRTTMHLTKKHGCTCEIIMKDVHTLNGERDRLTRWVNLARKAIAEIY